MSWDVTSWLATNLWCHRFWQCDKVKSSSIDKIDIKKKLADQDNENCQVYSFRKISKELDIAVK